MHNGGYIKRVPLLKLTPEGKKAAKAEGLWMFSGNHRRHVLEIYLEELREKLAVLEGKAAKYHERQSGAGASNAVDRKEKAAILAVNQLRGEIEMKLHWAVRIYDRGE